MTLIEIINKYIELSLRKKKLQDLAARTNSFEEYAITRYFNEDDEEVKGVIEYVFSTETTRRIKAETAQELHQVDRLLEQLRDRYHHLIEDSTFGDIDKTNAAICLKQALVSTKIDSLTSTREWATKKGDIASYTGDFNEEQEYNKIASEAYLELQDLEIKLHLYKIIGLDLQKQLVKKLESNSSKTR